MKERFLHGKKRGVVGYQLLFALVGVMLANPVWGQPAEFAGKTIHICDDGGEWPPYSYYKRVNEKPTEETIGFSVDVIRAILSKYDIPFTLELLPWKRCQSEVLRGTNYQMFLSGSKNPTREKNYHLSEPYYSSTPYYFWSKKHHPEGLDINTPTDLAHYQLGGVRGYGYSLLKKLNVDLSAMDAGASDIKALIIKLHRGRVDVFQEEWEILVGMSAIGVYDLTNDADLGRSPLPGADETQYYMMFTKQQPVGLALKTLIDRELILMKQSGRLETMFKKYLD